MSRTLKQMAVTLTLLVVCFGIFCAVLVGRSAARQIYPLTAACSPGHPVLHVVSVGIQSDVNGNPELQLSDPIAHVCPGDSVELKADDSLPPGGFDYRFDMMSMPIYKPMPASGPYTDVTLDFYARPSWWRSYKYTVCAGACGSGGLSLDPHIIIMGQ